MPVAFEIIDPSERFVEARNGAVTTLRSQVQAEALFPQVATSIVWPKSLLDSERSNLRARA